MKIRIMYRRARVTVDTMRPGECKACEWVGRLEYHHYHYAHTTAEVRKNPRLVLDNGIWLCYVCHKIADMFRNMAADQGRAHNVNAALIKKIKEDGNAKAKGPGNNQECHKANGA